MKWERLFVYGIFLSERNRKHYSMINPDYATVKDYATFGHHIVEAIHIPEHGLALTGLTVDIPSASWPELDALEGGYTRERVVTTDGEAVWMYVGKL